MDPMDFDVWVGRVLFFSFFSFGKKESWKSNDSNLKCEIWHHSECFVTSSFEWCTTLSILDSPHHRHHGPWGHNSWLATQEPVSPEQTDVEDQVAETLIKRHSELWRKWGAMSLYHRKDWVWDITKHDQFFTGWISTPKNSEFKGDSSLCEGTKFSNHESLLDLWSLVVGVGACNIGHIRKSPPKKENLAPEDLPFALQEAPGNYTELTLTLGWEVRCPGLGLGARPRPRSGGGGSKNWQILSGWVEIQKTPPIFCWVGHPL